MFGLVPFGKGNRISLRSDFFDLDNVFDNFFNDAFAGFFSAANPIRTDIRETDKEYIIEADMPGVRKEDIRLEIQDGVPPIGAEHTEPAAEKSDTSNRTGRSSGSYCRSFRLDGIKQDQVSAKYNDGVLVVTLPKSEEVKNRARRIDIN